VHRFAILVVALVVACSTSTVAAVARLTTGLGQLDFTELTTALIARGRSTALPAVAPTVVPVVIPAFTG
jgi:hypothetical protein